MFILLVKFHSGLPHDEVLRVMEERLPQFREVPGLLQKYSARETATGDYVGIYLFDSEAALQRYRSSELAASIPATYKVEGAPRREVAELLFPLRDEAAPGESAT